MSVNINNLATEKRNEKTQNLDILSIGEIISIMNQEDLNVVSAVKLALPDIEKLIEQTVKAYQNGGRIVYIGAGTSGRMALQDAVEVVPTFNSDRFIGLIAGGQMAFVKAVEGAEDSKQLCIDDLKNINLARNDIVIGVAASGRTPYVIGGLQYAKSIGCVTGSVCCNFNSEITKYADYPVELSAGAEILTGSTRLKSGTCQKIVLNMISTATMVVVGKVYKNLMVDVKATNEKLVERCRRIVMQATECSRETAEEALQKTNNNCKVAIVMILLGVSKEQAIEKLAKNENKVRKALNN